MLTAFGKLQNQINSLIGGSIYQGVWNANTNTPTLTSSVGTDGYYYIVNVAGSTNLNGITDWKIGDWAIFHGGTWQKVDNTESVSSVNGQTGAVSLTTSDVPEGPTNFYYNDSRARAALSFTAGSGAYNSTTGVITIPTNTSQLTNGANYITLASLSGTAPIQYNNTTGAISITQAGVASNGYLSSTDWNTFNGKQDALYGVGFVKASGGLITYDNTAYQPLLTNPVTGTGTVNYLPKFTGASTLGNSLIYDNGTNVGIGTTSPAAKLHIGESGAAAQLWLQRTDGYNPVKLIGGTLSDGSGFKITMNTTDAFAITSGGNVGIGTTSPSEKLSVIGGNIQLGAGYKLQYSSTAYMTPENNVSGAEIATGGILTIKTGGTTERVRVDGSGNVGIGTTSPSFQLQLSNDSAAKPGSPLWTVSSDIRIKENIRPYTDGLEKLMQVNPVYYDYNGKAGFSITKDNVGIIAQEMQEVLPNTIKTFTAKLNEGDENETELLSFNANELIYVLINSVKELKAEIEILKQNK